MRLLLTILLELLIMDATPGAPVCAPSYFQHLFCDPLQRFYYLWVQALHYTFVQVPLVWLPDRVRSEGEDVLIRFTVRGKVIKLQSASVLQKQHHDKHGQQ